MLKLLNDQFGRILLAAAIVAAVVAAYLNRAAPLPPLQDPQGQVRVKLDESLLIANNNEVFFPQGDAAAYALGKYVFAPPVVVRQFESVDLDLPPAGVMRPPQVLPDPGPALEGTGRLPRYGDEFPQATPAADQNPPQPAGRPAAGPAPATGGPVTTPKSPAAVPGKAAN
jgi:hypothetical protein